MRTKSVRAVLHGTVRAGSRVGLLGCCVGLLGCVASLVGCANLLDIESDAELVEQGPPPTGCQGKLWVKLTTDTDTDATGSARDIAPSYNQGIIDYLNAQNDRSGGIEGCEIDLEVGEGNNNSTSTEQAITGWRLDPDWDEVSTLFIFGTIPVRRVAGDLAEEGKVVIAGASSGSLASPEPISRQVSHPTVNTNGTESSVTEDVSTDGYPNVFFVGMDDSTIARGLLSAISTWGADGWPWWRMAPARLVSIHWSPSSNRSEVSHAWSSVVRSLTSSRQWVPATRLAFKRFSTRTSSGRSTLN